MQASWNQWSSSVNNYPATTFPNSFSNVPSGTSFPVPPAAPVTNPPAGSQFPNVYGSQQTPTSQQQQWQQWEQWQQQYAQWQQQYGDKFQGSVPTPGMIPNPGVPNTFPSIPPLPPSAPSAQPPPPDSVPPADKEGSNFKRPYEGTSSEEAKKQKTGKGKQETLESLIEAEKTFDEQFKSWEASFLQWKEQNVNHPDKTQYKEYEAKCEIHREQLLQKRQALRKKRESKEAEVAAAAAAAKEAALATSPAATAQQSGYSTSAASQNNPYMAAPNMMYPPMSAMFPSQEGSRVMPNHSANAYMPNYSMYSMPPPPTLPHMTGPPPLNTSVDEDLTKKNSQSFEFLSGSSTMANAKSIPGLDLVGSDKNNFASNIPPTSSLFSSYSQDITKPLHTSEDKPFNFPRPPQQNYNNNNNNTQNPYSYQGGRPNLESDSRMNHSNRNTPFSQFDRSNQASGGHDRFKNQSSYSSNEYSGGRDNYQYRKNDPEPNYRNNKFGNSNSSFTFNSDKYAKYLEDEYDDSRFRDPEPEEDYSPNKSNFQKDQSFRSNFSGRQNYRNDSGSYYGRNRGGDRDFNERNFKGDFNSRDDVRPSFQDRGREGSNFGGFNRDGNRSGGRGFGRSTFGRDNVDAKQLPNKFESVEKDLTMDVSRPISLLDLPPIKPPETFDKFQPPLTKPPDPFDTKFQQPLTKTMEPFDKKMNVDVPEPTKFFSENGMSKANEPSKLFNAVDNRSIPSRQEEDPMLVEPFVPAHIFDYNHGANSCSDNASSFEPIWVFDFSHGKKKTLDTFNLLSKPDVVTELVSKPESLSKKDNFLEGEPWGETEMETNTQVANAAAPPLPERIKNISSKTTNEERISSATASIDIREPSVDQNTDMTKNDRAWLMPKISLTRIEEKPPSKSIDDLLLIPGRNMRPAKIVIVMRGPPGSGKSYTAKLIKDKEVEMGGSAPRILSLDDYFVEDIESGESNCNEAQKSSANNYNYDAALEPSYLDSLVKSFKKNISDGFFPFIIVDSINDKLKHYDEMYNFAKSKGFQVYVCEMDRDIDICKKQNIHGRSEEDILKIINEWERTPSSQTVLVVENLIKSSVSTEMDEKENLTNEPDNVEKAKENADTSQDDTPDAVSETENQTASSAEKEAEEYSSYMEVLCSSKWEKMEQTEEKLARLDGVNRKRSTSFKEWLQLPEERDISWYAASKDASSAGDVSVPKKKRVRWADLEERVAQQKMREIGFVVGHTDWKRMMDPSFGGNALTRTKYI